MTPAQARHLMRKRAKDRAHREKINFGRALFLVRRSEVLVYLSRQLKRRVGYDEIARETGVPIGAVREICRNLKKRAESRRAEGSAS